ncbi:MAG TPA: hypothetical protein V6C89_18205 [Drouetiella sp.]
MTEAAESSWSESLLKATEFADGELGEGPLPSPFFESYKKALTQTSKISDDQIDALLKKASPEGKLYAACISYYCKTERKSPNPQDTLIRLENSKEHVFYRSGCRGINTTVGEVASALVKEKHFLNFDLPALSVMVSTANISRAVVRLARAQKLENSLVGEGDKSVLYAYFIEAHKHADKKQFEWLLRNGTPAGKLYGAILLHGVDPEAGKAALQSLQTDSDKVPYQSGCEIFNDTVKNIATELIKKQAFLDLPLAIK